ncbi:MAG TPA: hypothetical protein V6C65_34180 [Allocoleopsis sp.]
MGVRPHQALTSTCKAPVLPYVIHEGEVCPFKFWFNDSVRDGIFYRDELFCWLQTVAKSDRAKLYQEACRLAQRNVVVVTVGSKHCGLWVSLRSSDIVSLAQRHYLSPQSASLQTPPFRISS